MRQPDRERLRALPRMDAGVVVVTWNVRSRPAVRPRRERRPGWASCARLAGAPGADGGWQAMHAMHHDPGRRVLPAMQAAPRRDARPAPSQLRCRDGPATCRRGALAVGLRHAEGSHPPAVAVDPTRPAAGAWPMCLERKGRRRVDAGALTALTAGPTGSPGTPAPWAQDLGTRLRRQVRGRWIPRPPRAPRQGTHPGWPATGHGRR